MGSLCVNFRYAATQLIVKQLSAFCAKCIHGHAGVQFWPL